MRNMLKMMKYFTRDSGRYGEIEIKRDKER